MPSSRKRSDVFSHVPPCSRSLHLEHVSLLANWQTLCCFQVRGLNQAFWRTKAFSLVGPHSNQPCVTYKSVTNPRSSVAKFGQRLKHLERIFDVSERRRNLHTLNLVTHLEQ